MERYRKYLPENLVESKIADGEEIGKGHELIIGKLNVHLIQRR
jgi:hypothetical protein